MKHVDCRYERVEPSKKQRARREIRRELNTAVQRTTNAGIGVDSIDLDISTCGQSLIPGFTSLWTICRDAETKEAENAPNKPDAMVMRRKKRKAVEDAFSRVGEEAEDKEDDA